jgi:hypothetical protein
MKPSGARKPSPQFSPTLTRCQPTGASRHRDEITAQYHPGQRYPAELNQGLACPHARRMRNLEPLEESVGTSIKEMPTVFEIGWGK